MRSWPRMQLLNRLGGVLAATLQMDYLPGLFSGAFFTIRSARRADIDPDRTIQLLDAGGAIQRFWLTATALGLAIQPAMATLIFADYGGRDQPFTQDARAERRARALAQRLHEALRYPISDLGFVGRVGFPPASAKSSRSVRRPLGDLLLDAGPRPHSAELVTTSMFAQSVDGSGP
jgi:hypothetical protein